MVLGAARAVLRLPVRRWPSIAVIVALAIVVEVGLHAVRLPTLARHLGVALADAARKVPASSTTSPELSAADRERIDMARRVLSRRPFNGTCLRQSLVIGYLLRDRRPVMRLGVRKSDGVVQAHAWLEVAGGVIEDFRFVPSVPESFRVLPFAAEEG